MVTLCDRAWCVPLAFWGLWISGWKVGGHFMPLQHFVSHLTRSNLKGRMHLWRQKEQFKGAFEGHKKTCLSQGFYPTSQPRFPQWHWRGLIGGQLFELEKADTNFSVSHWAISNQGQSTKCLKKWDKSQVRWEGRKTSKEHRVLWGSFGMCWKGGQPGEMMKEVRYG